MAHPPASWIDRHLWAILGAAMTGYVGFLTGTSNAAAMTEKMIAIDARTAKIEARLGGRTDFMTCAVRTIDQLSNRLKLTPPCPLGIPD